MSEKVRRGQNVPGIQLRDLDQRVYGVRSTSRIETPTHADGLNAQTGLLASHPGDWALGH